MEKYRPKLPEKQQEYVKSENSLSTQTDRMFWLTVSILPPVITFSIIHIGTRIYDFAKEKISDVNQGAHQLVDNIFDIDSIPEPKKHGNVVVAVKNRAEKFESTYR